MSQSPKLIFHHSEMCPVRLWLDTLAHGSFSMLRMETFTERRLIFTWNMVCELNNSYGKWGWRANTGPVVRLGPNKFSFNSAQAVKTIYSMTRVFPKASYYDAFADPGTERALFNSRDNQQHARLKRTQASLYSMTTIKSYEPFVDTQTAVLEQKLREFSKTREIVSLPQFMQKYAFDVIGKITVSAKWGSLPLTNVSFASLASRFI